MPTRFLFTVLYQKKYMVSQEYLSIIRHLYPSISSSVCLPGHPHIRLPINPFAYPTGRLPFVFSSVNPSAKMAVRQPICKLISHPPIRASVYLSTYQAVRPSANLVAYSSVIHTSIRPSVHPPTRLAGLSSVNPVPTRQQSTHLYVRSFPHSYGRPLVHQPICLFVTPAHIHASVHPFAHPPVRQPICLLVSHLPIRTSAHPPTVVWSAAHPLTYNSSGSSCVSYLTNVDPDALLTQISVCLTASGCAQQQLLAGRASPVRQPIIVDIRRSSSNSTRNAECRMQKAVLGTWYRLTH